VADPSAPRLAPGSSTSNVQDTFNAGKPDIDAQETQEWLDALEAVLENEGVDRAHYLLERLIDKARRSGAYLPYSANTAYLNTIP